MSSVTSLKSVQSVRVNVAAAAEQGYSSVHHLPSQFGSNMSVRNGVNLTDGRPTGPFSGYQLLGTCSECSSAGKFTSSEMMAIENLSRPSVPIGTYGAQVDLLNARTQFPKNVGDTSGRGNFPVTAPLSQGPYATVAPVPAVNVPSSRSGVTVRVQH